MDTNTSEVDGGWQLTASEGDLATYDPMTETYHTRFDPDDDSAGDAAIVAIVETVGCVTDCDPTELPPIFDSIHSGALADIVTTARGGTVEVTFDYVECRITVSSRGEIVLEQLDE